MEQFKLFGEKNQIYEINSETSSSLKLILYLSENKQDKYSEFTNQCLVNLVKRVMLLQNDISKKLNEEHITFIQRGFQYLFHYENGEQYAFIYHFNRQVVQRILKNFNGQLNAEFIQFYTWIEDIKKQLIQVRVDEGEENPQKLNSTHGHLQDLNLILEKNCDHQKINKEDVEILAQQLLNNILDFQIKLAQTENFLQKLIHLVFKIGQQTNNLNSKVAQTSKCNEQQFQNTQENQMKDDVSQTNELIEFIFSVTFAHSSILMYMKSFIDLYELDIEKDILDLFDKNNFTYSKFINTFSKFVLSLEKGFE